MILLHLLSINLHTVALRNQVPDQRFKGKRSMQN